MTTQEMIFTLQSNPMLKAFQSSRPATTITFDGNYFVDDSSGNAMGSPSFLT
jgi:hypothetical protein